MDVLSNPEFIGFWAYQRRNYSDRQFVVILEDSDAALMTRGAENREQVSAILNLSDGMLADFLRVQIICTINCRADDIDQALLRLSRNPGAVLRRICQLARIFHKSVRECDRGLAGQRRSARGRRDTRFGGFSSGLDRGPLTPVDRARRGQRSFCLKPN
jgi:hypothetical protein